MSRIRIVEGELTLNSKGNHYMYSQENISFSANGFINEAAKNHSYGTPVEAPLQEIEAKCIVHFRPKKDWKGEDYGFDWMRIGDINLINGQNVFGDTNYKEIVSKQYTDNAFSTLVTDINSYEGHFKKDAVLYAKLRHIYDAHTISWKQIDDGTGNCVPEEYYCSWLSIYPKAKAIISLIVDIEEEPDLLRFEDNENFKITPKEIIVKGRGKKALPDHITIECLKEFNNDQTITVSAIKQDDNCNDQKLVAGKIKVWANDVSKQKSKKVVFVQVIPYEGALSRDINLEKDRINKYLGQALIALDETSDIVKLDVCDDKDSFDSFINGAVIKINNGAEKLHRYLNKKLVEKMGNQYDSHFKAFFLNDPGDGVSGYSYMGADFAVVFSGANDQTAAHEFLHSLELPHSFSNQECEEIKHDIFTYEYARTENLMDYSHHVSGHRDDRCNFWYWQWKIANQSIIK